MVRRHNRTARRKVFRCFGGAYEARCLVERKRHNCNIPARHVGRELCIVFPPEVVEVARLGSEAGSIFTTGPIMTKDQSGLCGRQRGDQGKVDVFVDNAVVADDRTGQIDLVAGGRLVVASLGEMRVVDARRKRMDVLMSTALGL